MNTPSLDLETIAAQYNTPEKARAFFEKTRWPYGPVCPHCGGVNHSRPMSSVRGQRKGLGKIGKSKPCRPGLWFCLDCSGQYSVTLGTIMESSKLPLHKWLLTFFLIGASKKGISAHQVHRTLKISYESAWFLCHRVRYAMGQEPLKSRLEGVVEFDETYVGGKQANRRYRKTPPPKYPVLTLVQRDGGSRSMVMGSVSASTLKAAIARHVARGSTLYADSWNPHKSASRAGEVIETVNHEKGEYVRGPVHTNTVEGFFGLLKRGIFGVYHHVSGQHLQAYLNEFDFRYSHRKTTDGDRTLKAITASQGKRLKYTELPAHGQEPKATYFTGGYTYERRAKNAQPEPPFGPPTGGDQP